jgi:hypothetical protein
VLRLKLLCTYTIERFQDEAQTREVDTTTYSTEDALVFPSACRCVPARGDCLLGEGRLGRKERSHKVLSILQCCGMLQHCRERRLLLAEAYRRGIRLITVQFSVGVRLTESQKKSGVEMPRASHTICPMDLRA